LLCTYEVLHFQNVIIGDSVRHPQCRNKVISKSYVTQLLLCSLSIVRLCIGGGTLLGEKLIFLNKQLGHGSVTLILYIVRIVATNAHFLWGAGLLRQKYIAHSLRTLSHLSRDRSNEIPQSRNPFFSLPPPLHRRPASTSPPSPAPPPPTSLVARLYGQR
jgi:hypothetical protein